MKQKEKALVHYDIAQFKIQKNVLYIHMPNYASYVYQFQSQQK